MNKARARWLTKRWETIQRKIEFNLTFEEWYDWWLSHGVDKNTDSRHDVCMCRKNDQGAYELGNIYFATRAQNVIDAHTFNPRKQTGSLNHNYGNRGVANPLSKKIQTPKGVFNSLKEAAMAYDVSSESIRKRTLRDTTKEEYFYL